MTDRSDRRLDAHLPADLQPQPGKLKLPRSTWPHIFRSTVQRLSDTQATDLAATLTYYTVFAAFPGLLAVVSLIKLSAIGERLLPQLIVLITQAIPDDATAQTLVEIVEGFFSSSGAGFALVIGIATAVWAASGYLAAFSRALNRVHGVEEGRSALRLKSQQLALTVLVLVSVVAILAGLVLSGGAARWVGDLFGLPAQSVALWDVAKWPVIWAILMMLVATLYHWAPNLTKPRFQVISLGSGLAVLSAFIAAAGFSFYVVNFANYDKTYGTLAGVIIGLLLLWMTNLTLLVGVHLDVEVRRVRQLLLGLPAERVALLSPRDAAGVVKKQQKRNSLAAEAHQIRIRAQQD